MVARTGRAAFAGVFLALIVAAVVLAVRGNVERSSFKAFYCAGAAVREGRDPYRVEPLRACERKFEIDRYPRGYVEPAPLPGYALLPFVALSFLSEKSAAILFALLIAVAAGLSAACLTASIRAPAAAILLALAPLTLLNIAFGEPAPLAMLALCGGAFFATNDRWRAAGIATSFALLQPNVGFAAVVSLLIFAPRARAAVVLTTAFLAAVSFALLGVPQNVEYLTNVLPLMARAELVAADQFSSSRLLYVAGVAPQTAIAIAQLWFAVTLVAGLFLAGAFVRAGRRDTIVLLPPAAVLLLCLYLHDVQILIAVPAALVVASLAPGSIVRPIGIAAVALLVAVWTQPAQKAVIFLDVAGVAGGLFAVLGGPFARRLSLALLGGALTTICLIVLHRLEPAMTGANIFTHPFDSAPNAFAAAAWAKYLLATPALTAPAFAPQVAAWLGLTALLVCAAVAKPNRYAEPQRQSANAPCSGASTRCD